MMKLQECFMITVWSKNSVPTDQHLDVWSDEVLGGIMSNNFDD